MNAQSNMMEMERLELVLKIRDVISGYTEQEREAALRFLSDNDDVPERIKTAFMQFFNIIWNTANK